MKCKDIIHASTSTPDPVTAALEAFVTAPNLFEAMVTYLTNPNTPASVRQIISDILHAGERLGTNWLVA
jgi:hypothetical protein